jgi:serine O-acetyltransferase
MPHRLATSLDTLGLCRLAGQQLNNLFPDGQDVMADALHDSAALAMQRLEHCFSRVNNRYFFDGTQAVFDHLHGDQYAMWLYFLSNQLYRDGAPVHFCKKLFLLNKSLHGCDIFYEVALPSVFLLVHPLGSVLGRADYSDNLLVYQRCGVGSNHDVYPRLGRHLSLRPGSAVLGRCVVGDNVTVAAESLVLDRDLADNITYIGNPRDYVMHARHGTEKIWRTRMNPA